MRVVVGAWLLVVALAAPVDAQTPVVPGGELDAYLRLLELRGQVTGRPLMFFPGSARWPSAVTGPDHPWSNTYAFHAGGKAVTLEPLDADARLTFNSAIPHGANDGVLWAGRGLSGVLSAGARLRAGPVTATVYPAVTFAQNQRFDLAPVTYPGLSSYAYPWQGLQTYREYAYMDYPQRFGDRAITTVDWGQSGVRLNLGAFTAGVSAENLWWGPAMRNPILMSTTAGGFPHVDLGTGRPLSGNLGTLEARLVWGGLRQSEYFDPRTLAPALSYEPRADGSRFLTGVVLGYRPPVLPGLTVGLSRVLYQAWPDGGLGAGELLGSIGRSFNPFLDTLANGQLGNDLWDQMIAVSARWVLPTSEFEAYVEWARNDFSGNPRDLILEPDHSRAFTAGFQKLLHSGRGTMRLAGELTTLGRSLTFLERSSLPYYMHYFTPQGYTDRGQLVGAGIGPGSQSQYMGVDRYFASGRWGVFLERVRFDDDAAFSLLRRDSDGLVLHDVALTAGVSTVRFASRFDIIGQLELTRQLNRFLIDGNDVTNVKLTFGLRWRTPRP
ncbi:MAG: hypothetical protein EXR93_00510 [Gemmatimonadetes bacterium]|nr:hypothetical protein [Gemmatimonadota bacterium]